MRSMDFLMQETAWALRIPDSFCLRNQSTYFIRNFEWFVDSRCSFAQPSHILLSSKVQIIETSFLCLHNLQFIDNNNNVKNGN